MPTLNEFMSNFGTTEAILSFITIAIIIFARESGRIFRRK